ncbi:MAG: SAF domain-containing protein [Sedimentitalea sp.]
MKDFIRLNADDNVVTATRALEVRSEIDGVTTTALIPSGHKIATRAIRSGEQVRKYAQFIGLASEDIAPGAHVHTIYDAEHLLTRRAVDRATGDKLVGLIKWWEDYTARNRGNMDNDPSPGNKRGREIYQMLLRVASGETSKSKPEAQSLGDYEFLPWQIGAVMCSASRPEKCPS